MQSAKGARDRADDVLLVGSGSDGRTGRAGGGAFGGVEASSGAWRQRVRD